jgi:hypothetical protein
LLAAPNVVAVLTAPTEPLKVAVHYQLMDQSSIDRHQRVR